MLRSLIRLSAFGLLTSALCLGQGLAYPYSVSLVCSPPASGTPTGYNFYRAPYTSGACATSYTKLNATPIATCSYSDTTVTQGAYCYGATDTSATGESGLSNINQNIQIPAPPPTGLNATVAIVKGTSEIQWAFTQSTGTGLTANALLCSSAPTGTFTQRALSPRPVLSFTVSMGKGKHYCGVTAFTGKLESGLSNVAEYTVN